MYIKALEKLVEKVAINSNYKFNAEYDGVDHERNVELYDIYLDKLKNSIYKKRPNVPVKTLENGRDTFIALSEIEQASALLSIHQIFGRMSGGIDLQLIGGKKLEGSVKVSSQISNWAKTYSDVRIIDVSASGIYESRSENLLELL